MLFVGAALRLWGIGFGLPNLNARPDETAITEAGVSVLRGTFQPRSFNYPTLFMYVTGAGYALYCGGRIAAGSFSSLAACADTWKHAWEPFFLIPRFLSAIAGTASILLIFALGRRLGRDDAERTLIGLTAAALLAVSFLHVRDSHFGVTDVSMTAALLASLLLLGRAHERPSASRFLAAGLAGGLATSIKYNAALLIAPLAVSQALEWYGAVRARRRPDRRALIFGGAAVIGFALGCPYAFVDRRGFLRDLTYESQHLREGHDGIVGTIGWVQHVLVTLPNGVGWVLLVTALVGMAWMFADRPKRAALLFSFPIVYYVVSGLGYTVFPRYMIPVVPFLCLAAAGLIVALAGVGRRSAWTLALVLAIACAIPNIVKSLQHDRLLSRTDSRVIAAAWVAREIPDGATIYEAGSVYARPDLWRRGQGPPYHLWRWDSEHHEFDGAAGTDVWPEWMLLPDSPLDRYDEVPPEVIARLENYDLTETIVGTNLQPHLYDQQDAWYLPIDGFAGIERPGPTVRIYQKRPRSAESR